MTRNVDRVSCLSCLRLAPRELFAIPRIPLACPACGTQHVDEGPWAIRHHRTHLCKVCGREWRPHAYPTFGAAL